METFESSGVTAVHVEPPVGVSDHCSMTPMLKRSSASFSSQFSESDSSVHGGGNFFAFALSHTSSPLGRPPPAPLDQPESPSAQHMQQHEPSQQSEGTPQSPDDIMQRIHNQNLDAAAEALASFSMKPEPCVGWQQGDWDAAMAPPRPHGFMASPRAQSWPPMGRLQ